MAYYLDINEFFKQQKQAQERMKVFEKLEEQQRQNTLREAYKIIHKKKAYLQVKEIFDDLINHPDSGKYLKNILHFFEIPKLPDLTPEQEMEVKVAHLASVFGVKNDIAEKQKIRAMLQDANKYFVSTDHSNLLNFTTSELL